MAASDIKVVADFTDLQLMRRELVGVSKDAKASAGVFEREFNKVSNALSRSAKTSQSYYNETLKVDRASKSAAQSASAMEKALLAQERAATQSAKARATANRRLRMEFREGYAAQVQLRAAQMRLNQARRQGIITDQQYRDQVTKLRVAQTNSTAQLQRNTRAMGHGSVITQQAGYQIGDFLVQVQSGTNAMVAFGQQATQVAGTLTILGGKWVLIGSALGITIPAVTAFAAYLMRTSGAQKEVADGADEMMSAYSSLKSKQDELNDSVERYGDALQVAKAMANSDSTILLSNLSAELSARKELLAVEKERFELRRFELQEEIKQRKEVIDGLFTMSEQQRQTALATAFSEAERMAINKTYLEDTRRIIEGNRELFLNQREQQATLDLIDALLESSAENVENAATAAERFAAALKEAKLAGDSLATLQFEFSAGGRAMALYGGRGTVSDRPIEGDLPEGYGGTVSTRARSSGGGRSSPEREAKLNLDAYQESLKEVIALENERKALIAPMATSFTDGLTAIVEGTKSVKDAFKDMAREVIKQLWDIYVTQQIVSGITGMFGNVATTGTNAIPSNNPLSGMSGSQMLPSFAGGGYTGDGSRSGGMDGQGGYLAMLHPRETVVDHTKGQSTGGNVNIVQNFSFSANGDESVKKIIAQAAPQIAQMTQKSMMDQRRRGGALKSTFG